MVVYKLQWSPRLGTMKSRRPNDIRGLRNHHRLLLDQSLWSPKTFILTASFTQVSTTPSCRLLVPFSAWFHNHCKSLQWNHQTNPALYAAISSIYRFLNWIDGLLARMCSAKCCSPAIYIYIFTVTKTKPISTGKQQDNHELLCVCKFSIPQRSQRASNLKKSAGRNPCGNWRMYLCLEVNT